MRIRNEVLLQEGAQSFPYVVSGFSRTVTVRLKADTTYVYEMGANLASNSDRR
jgi:hypothetical protein